MEGEKRTTIQNALYPAYFPNFRCIADKCQNNCCHGWTIGFDKKDYLAIKKAVKSSKLEGKAKEGIRRKRGGEEDGMYAEFAMQGTRCAFQNEQGLCELQLECGEKALPRVCREFPRISKYTPMGRESSLSTGCEAVLWMLWDLPEGIGFIEGPLQKTDWLEYAVRPKDAIFPQVRSHCIDLLQARHIPLEHRLILLGILLDKACQQEWDGDWTAWERLAKQLAHSGELKDIPRQQGQFLAHYVQLLLTLTLKERSNVDEWQAILDDLQVKHEYDPVRQTIHVSFDQKKYREAEEDFAKHFGAHDYFFENLMVHVFFTMAYPTLSSPKELWQSYVSLCNLYGFFKFTAIARGMRDSSKENLFQSIVLVSRTVLHNQGRREKMRDDLFQNHSNTLAHMAILVQG